MAIDRGDDLQVKFTKSNKCLRVFTFFYKMIGNTHINFVMFDFGCGLFGYINTILIDGMIPRALLPK